MLNNQNQINNQNQSKMKVVKTVLVAAFVGLGFTVVNAQDVSSYMNNIDDQSKARQTAYDQDKLDAYSNSAITLTDPAQIAKQEAYDQKIKDAMEAAGYMFIPNFVLTDDPDLNDENYGKALDLMREKQPDMFNALMDGQ